MADRRIDITPQPAHFDHVAPPDRGVTASDVMVALLALAALVLAVGPVTDAWSRVAGVLLVIGATTAWVARRVEATRTV